MAVRINYTKAELLSFKLLPPTCDAIDADIDRARDNAAQDIIPTLAKYGITSPDRQLLHAIRELISRTAFDVAHAAMESTKFKGTFPLRLALVRKLEDELRAQGEVIQPNHYEQWLEDHAERKRLREAVEPQILG